MIYIEYIICGELRTSCKKKANREIDINLYDTLYDYS